MSSYSAWEEDLLSNASTKIPTSVVSAMSHQELAEISGRLVVSSQCITVFGRAKMPLRLWLKR